MSGQQQYSRFNIARRIEHWLLFLSFSLLALTGLAQKFATVELAQWVVGVFGGVETTRIIHRISAIVFGLESICHFVLMGYKMFVLREKASMFPRLRDAADGFQMILYNFGISKKKPKMGRYNFAEKIEYWATMWGLLVMGLTGFLMLNPIGATSIFPGEIIPAAKAAHGAEAILAVLALIVWHGYHVHLRSLNTAMFNGKISRHEMEEEHARELEEIESGATQPAILPPSVLKKRRLVYGIVSGILSVTAVAMLIYLITYEKTAITTIPPQENQAAVFVQQTATPIPLPRTRTPLPTGTASPETGDLTWSSSIDLMFQERCSDCHGEDSGMPIDTYADLRIGQEDAMIVPGDVETSLLYLIQRKGTHLGQFNAEELAALKAWIEAGANE